jgi:hypothetical protein
LRSRPIASSKLIVRYRVALGSFMGSALYTPSTLVALSTTSAPISAPRRAAAVSVVKNGLPVPAAKITTLPSSRYCSALGRMYGSTTWSMRSADIVRAVTPAARSASCSASAFITVASMPM